MDLLGFAIPIGCQSFESRIITDYTDDADWKRFWDFFDEI